MNRSAVHLERTLESAIVRSMVKNGLVSREAPFGYGRIPAEDRGYIERRANKYDARLGLDTELVIQFLQTTQAKEWEKLEQVHGEQREERFLKRLADELDRRGAIDVLRGTVKDHGCTFRLAYFAPASGLNPEHAKLYSHNILSVMRQVAFSETTEETLDLVLFLNGIPVATAELKHHLTGQNVQDAMKQYRRRDPREPLFAFLRVPAHFALDNDLVYVTTKLNGKATEFLPFNKGVDDGAGNPANPEGFKSAYLWEDIWTRDVWLDVLGHFINTEKRRDVETGKIVERQVFPRYHQLDAVRRLVADARQNGAGQRYLIQHSAGSGKSNTIAWLVHRLAELHDARDERVFDTVIVVTDRRVLDRQLRATIKGFERVAGVVVGVTQGSQELRQALESGKQIIVTTIQKFPYIASEIGELTQKRFAIVIDEAHSGQSGETQRALSAVLNVKSLEEAEVEDEVDASLEDEILETLRRTGMAKNASYFAFTATPKARTLEMFGIRDADGRFQPFSLYTMRQAIEEGFILDVLANYTTFKVYFNLRKKIEGDPKYDRKQAIGLMLRYADLEEHGILRKAQIMARHFCECVRSQIGGKAKAMVVTRSRLHAVRYKQAFDQVLQEEKLGIKALVAFSGTVRDPETGLEYTEPGMNGFPESQTAAEFELPENRFLIVAEKFQTGFDQPLLHTMYVDKTLTGLNAVQTLSRLNRTHPEKDGCFVLDFANEAEAIQEAFEPYYRATILSEGTDPNRLYDLEREILDFELFDEEEVTQFCSVLYDKGKTAERKLAELHSLLDPVRERFLGESEERRSEFKRHVEHFVRLYAFVSQIISFSDVGLEKLYQYCRLLRGKLPLTRQSRPAELLQQIQLDAYRVVKRGVHHLSLSGDEELRQPEDSGSSSPPESEEEFLSALVREINAAFGTDFDEGDRVMLAEVERRVLSDEGLRNAVLSNRKEAVRLLFAPVFDRALTELIDDNLDLYKKIVENERLQSDLKQALFESVYKKLVRYGSEEPS